MDVYCIGGITIAHKQCSQKESEKEKTFESESGCIGGGIPFYTNNVLRKKLKKKRNLKVNVDVYCIGGG